MVSGGRAAVSWTGKEGFAKILDAVGSFMSGGRAKATHNILGELA